MKKVILIVTGPTQKSIAKRVGDKLDWYSRLISSEGVQIDVREVYLNDVIHPDEGDGWIITGSEYSVVDDDYPWLESLEKAVREAIKQKKPMLGICFGHQLIAKALNGKVWQNPHGWEVGGCTVQLTEAGRLSPVFEGLPKKFPCAETHRDAVLELSDGCIELASNSMGIQAFQYGNSVFCVQFHPEFTQEIMQEYVQFRLQAGIPVISPDIPDLSHTEKIFTNFLQHTILGEKNANSIIYD